MLASLDNVMKEKERCAKDKTKSEGFDSLFGAQKAETPVAVPKWVEAAPMPDAERLELEKECLGFYVSGHPLGKYDCAVNAFSFRKPADLQKIKNKIPVKAAGMIKNIKVRQDIKKRDYAFATLEDASGRIEIAIWASAYASVRNLRLEDKMAVVEGKLQPQEKGSRFGSKIFVDQVWILEEELGKRARSVVLKSDREKLPDLRKILEGLETHPPNSPRKAFYVRINDGANGEGVYSLANPPKMTLEALGELEKVLGRNSIRIGDDLSPPSS
jgi:DNA polymerase-3 subunit alpha